MNHTLIRAIQKRKLLSIYLEGRFQVVEPYAYGVTRLGTEVLCYRRRDGQGRDWEMLPLKSIKYMDWSPEGDFEDRPRSGEWRAVMKEMYAQV